MFGLRGAAEYAFGEAEVGVVRGTRALTLAAALLLQQDTVRAVQLFEAEFDSGTIYYTNGPYTITWNGNDYIAVGAFSTFGTVEENVDLQTYSVTAGLSGIPTELVGVALAEAYQGRPARMYIALLDEDHQLTTDPIMLFAGRMDTMEVEAGDKASIMVRTTNGLEDWARARIRRYNQEDQKLDYEDDKGFEYVEAMIDLRLVWGKTF